MKTRILALILVVAMLLSLTACGGSQSDQQTDPSSTTENTEPSSETTQPESTTEPEEEPSEEPVEEGPTQESAEQDDPMLGVYDAESYTYTNEFLGLNCQVDEQWVVFDAQQIAELQGLMSELVTDDEIRDKIESTGSAQVFYAQAEDGLVTLNIVLENLGLLYGTVLDEEGYAELGVEQLAPALESMGMSDVSAEVTSMDFAGEEHAAIVVHGVLQDVDFYEVIVCFKVDRYIAAITAGSYMADVTGDTLGMFSSL